VSVIKRYPNRKLYDTAAKRYVSLGDIAALIRGGAEVQVVDHATGEDLTALILMQVIVEQEKRQRGFLPQTVLAGLVQAGGDTLSALRRGLSAPLDLVRQVDEEIEQRIEGLVWAGELAEEDGRRLRDRLVALGDRLTPAIWPTEASVRHALLRLGIPARTEVQALADQLEALEAELDALLRRRQANDRASQ
jgi:polyhydroxyalkanoate synthesis repressor PhaR